MFCRRGQGRGQVLGRWALGSPSRKEIEQGEREQDVMGGLEKRAAAAPASSSPLEVALSRFHSCSRAAVVAETTGETMCRPACMGQHRRFLYLGWYSFRSVLVYGFVSTTLCQSGFKVHLALSKRHCGPCTAADNRLTTLYCHVASLLAVSSGSMN